MWSQWRLNLWRESYTLKTGAGSRKSEWLDDSELSASEFRQTEVVIFGPFSSYVTTLHGISLASGPTVRNFGVISDQDLSFDSHIKQVSTTAFFHLRNIVKIRNILSQSDAEKLGHAFVTSSLDYCNSLLLGCPTNSLKSLQLIQNTAARILMRTNRKDYISPVLASLHWLPVKSKI